jgi:hypothetical protein
MKIPSEFIHTDDLYANGFQSMIVCRDCWQTNYLHESDTEHHDVTCMCGHKYDLWIDVYLTAGSSNPIIQSRTLSLNK